MSYKDTLLISENTLKENSILQDNVDMSMVQPTIMLVQDMKLQPILGTQLYRAIQQAVYDDNVTAEYKTLLDDYIENALVYGVISEASYDLTFKFTNLSVNTNSGDNEQALPIDELNYISQKNKDRMEWYLNRLDDYLWHNRSDYPKFDDNTDEDIRPSRDAYTSNIYLGRSRNYKDRLPADVRYSKRKGG